MSTLLGSVGAGFVAVASGGFEWLQLHCAIGAGFAWLPRVLGGVGYNCWVGVRMKVQLLAIASLGFGWAGVTHGIV